MEEFSNSGRILLRCDAPGFHGSLQEGTLIVSGVARSGTSMVARLLARVGVPMGDEIDDVVFEDVELLELFSRGAMEELREAIRIRDQRNPVWGFKRPHLHVHGPEIIRLFRNPRVIITSRDPVAITGRNLVSEQFEKAAHSLVEAAQDLSEAMRFAAALDCPTLLVSYEKAIQHPADFVETLLDFCGIAAAPERMATLLETIEPGREVYRMMARRQFRGYIDGVRDGTLFGWADQIVDPTPVELTLCAEETEICHFIADLAREDLAEAGIGLGRHGFAVDLSGYDIPPEARLSVKIRGRSFRLTHSGRSLNSWCQEAAA